MSWRAELIAIWAFALRNLLMASRNVFFFFELTFWPVVNVLSIGLMTRFLGLTAETGMFILIGQMAFSIVQVCQLDVSYAVLYDVWSKSMKHQFLAPISIRHLTIGSWLVGVGRGVVVFALQGALVWWAFGFAVLAPGIGPVVAFLLGCFLTAWIVGILVCALVMLFGSRAETSAWATVNLVVVLAGIYYPVAILPPPVAVVASGIPLTYVLEAYRSHFGFPAGFAAPLATGFALAVTYVLLAHVVLVAALGRTRRSGLLLKMSE